tara:strand:+ start:8550 stop:9239 length:690 start_codon:yes stop_codon:yes gene_type:complete
MKNLFVIPARSGSKGIPNKNIKEINGIPMFIWSIVHAQYIADKNDIVCLSSDNEDYLKLAQKWNAETRLRPAELASDTAPTEPVIEDVISQYDLDENDNIILLEPTTPLRSKNSLENLKKLIQDGEESVLSVKKVYQFEWEKLDNENFRPSYKERPRRQDMLPKYIENGSIYFTKLRIFNELKNRVGLSSKLIIMDDVESIDVDGVEQLNLVNTLGKEFNKQWEEEVQK